MTEPGPVADAAAARRGTDAALTVMRLYRALERVQCGLTPQQYRILKMAGAGGERSARLAERLAVAKPTLTATADGLVAAGLAHRVAEPGDRRVVRLCLTPAGESAVARADAAYSAWLGELLDAAGEPDQVLRGLELLSTALDEVRRSRLAPAHERRQPAVTVAE
ncbi:MAG: MarR family winged helix-turn-helix transcriptional regulator [Streptosporangiaceae bacterium]|jgi:DNA-binding MarR family transcriptional regulator